MSLRKNFNEIAYKYGNKVIADSTLLELGSLILSLNPKGKRVYQDGKPITKFGFGDFLKTNVTLPGMYGIAGATYLAASPFIFATSSVIDNKILKGATIATTIPGTTIDAVIATTTGPLCFLAIPIAGYTAGLSIYMAQRALAKEKKYEK